MLRPGVPRYHAREDALVRAGNWQLYHRRAKRGPKPVPDQKHARQATTFHCIDTRLNGLPSVRQIYSKNTLARACRDARIRPAMKADRADAAAAAYATKPVRCKGLAAGIVRSGAVPNRRNERGHGSELFPPSSTAMGETKGRARHTLASRRPYGGGL